MKRVNMTRKGHFMKPGYENYTTNVQDKASQGSVNSSTGAITHVILDIEMVKLGGHFADR